MRNSDLLFDVSKKYTILLFEPLHAYFEVYLYPALKGIVLFLFIQFHEIVGFNSECKFRIFISKG